MPVNLICPKCGKSYALRDEMAGKHVRCSCGVTLSVPSSTVSAVRPPEVQPPSGYPPAHAMKRSSMPLLLAGVGLVLLMVFGITGGVVIFSLLRSHAKSAQREVAAVPVKEAHAEPSSLREKDDAEPSAPPEKDNADPTPRAKPTSAPRRNRKSDAPREEPKPSPPIEREPATVRREPPSEAPPLAPAREKPKKRPKTLTTLDRLTIELPPVAVAEPPTPKVWEGHTATIRGVAYTDDGRFVVSVSGAINKVEGGKKDNSIRLWDARRGKQIRKLDRFREELDAVSVSPGGRFAVFGFGGHFEGDKWIDAADHHVRLWDLQDNQEVYSGNDLVAPNQETGTPDAEKKRRKNTGAGGVIDRLEPRFQGLKSSVFSTAFSPDRKRVVGVDNLGGIVLWDTASGKARIQGEIEAIARPREDGRMFTVTGTTCIRFAPDGRWLLSGGHDYTVRLWDAKTGRQLHRFESHQDIVWAVAVATGKGGRLLGLSGGGSRYELKPDRFTPGARDYAIRLWDLKARREIRRFVGHQHDVYSLVFCPNGRHFLSASFDATVRLWDIDSGKVLRIYRGHTAAIRSVAVSPDGRSAVSGGGDCILRYWRLPANADDLAHALDGKDRTRLAEVVADLDTMGLEIRGVFPKLAQALLKADEATAELGLKVLRHLGEPDAAWVGDLRAILASSSPAVRANAAELLGRLHGRAASALDDLRKALSDVEPTVRRAAVEAVAVIGKETAQGIDDLTRLAAREKDATIRAEALRAILRIDPRHPSARLRLHEMIAGGDAAARAAALQSLIDLGPTPDDLPTCLKVLDDPANRDLAGVALEKMSAPSSPSGVTRVLKAVTDTGGPARPLLLNLLGRAAKLDAVEARPVLWKYLHDADARTRCEAALVIVKRLPTDKEAIAEVLPVLIEALKKGRKPASRPKDDKVAQVRAALVEIGQPATAALFKVLQENKGDAERETWTRYHVYLTFTGLGSKAYTILNRTALNNWAKKEARKAPLYGTREIFDAAFQAVMSLRKAER
ncbi:MAG: HEAT repeat domain-containing protein [Gemmataceae bacterium]